MTLLRSLAALAAGTLVAAAVTVSGDRETVGDRGLTDDVTLALPLTAAVATVTRDRPQVELTAPVSLTAPVPLAEAERPADPPQIDDRTAPALATRDRGLRFDRPTPIAWASAPPPAFAADGATPALFAHLAAATPPLAEADDPNHGAAAFALALSEALARRPLREGPEQRVVSIDSGDTLMAVLTRAGVGRPDAHAAIAAVEEVFNPRRLRAGQEITLSFHHRGRFADFTGLRLMTDATSFAAVERDAAGDYSAVVGDIPLVTRRSAAAGIIAHSLAGDAGAAGVPYRVLHRLIRAYSYDVDFQRDVRAGDSFRLLFEQDFTEDGQLARHGAVLYAELTVSGETRTIIRYRTADGEVDYYDPDGLSVRKALLRTPVDGLRMSSGFGMRRHPILGYSRMHRGVDFAGPTGTPILAAGDGTVEVIGRNRGYGNYIRLRHTAGLQTAYAHMSRFAGGLGRGSRVRQGEVIGYVGSTGMSTGPHLHYEVLVNGAQVNPLTIDMPTGRQLDGTELADFRALTAALAAELDTLVAQAGQVAAIPN